MNRRESSQSTSMADKQPKGNVTTGVGVCLGASTVDDSVKKTIGATNSRLFLLYGIIILQFTIFLTELITDQFLHSLLILTDAYHHLFNTCNAILLLVCFKISNQITVKNTFGWVRMEVLGMLTTITFIVALIFSLLIEGALQLLHLHERSGPTNGKVLIVFGIWSLVVNILYVLIINGVVTEKKYKQTTRTERSFSTANCENNQVQSQSTTSAESGIALKQLNQEPRKATTSDASRQLLGPDSNNNRNRRQSTIKIELPVDEPNCFLGSLLQGLLSPSLVIFSSVLIICFNDSDLVLVTDPLVGVITAVLLCISFFPQLKNTIFILMQTVPENVNILQMKKELLNKFKVIQNIHEFHIWRLTSSQIVATCHIVLPSQTTKEYVQLFETIRSFLHTKYGITYVTIQPEFKRESRHHNDDTEKQDQPYAQIIDSMTNNECLMKCPRNTTDNGCEQSECEKLTCCASNLDSSQHNHHHHHHSHFHSHP